MIRIDHVVLAVHDLDAASASLTAGTGLTTIAGGRHAMWGTANRIVPLGDDYVELLAVVDPEVGVGTRLGRILTSLTEDGEDRWFSVCLADPEIEATADRLGLAVEAGARTRPDGVEVRWRGAGIEDPARPDWLPFFIHWDVAQGQHPGRSPVEHLVAVNGIASVTIAGDPEVMRSWLGEADVPLRVADDGGAYGVRAVEISVEGGDPIVIEGAPPR